MSNEEIVENWVGYIKNHEVVPIIGDGLSMVELPSALNDQQTELIDFSDFLKEAFVGKVSLSEQEFHDNSLDHVLLHTKRPKTSTLIDQNNKGLRSLLGFQTLELLAQISQFDRFISFSNNTLLETALTKYRNQSNSLVSHNFYSHQFESHNKELDHIRELVSSSDINIINMLGKYSKQDLSFAPKQPGLVPFYDDQRYSLLSRLEYNHNSSLVQQDGLHKILIEYLIGKKLLFIGFEYPHWFVYVALRALMPEHSLNDTIMLFVDNSPVTKQRSYHHDFLTERLGAELYKDDHLGRNTHHVFLNEIVEGLKKRNRSKGSISVFLSYSSEDELLMRQLTIRLKKAGVYVWIDRDNIRFGEHIHEQVIKGIEGSTVFVPLISDKLLSYGLAEDAEEEKLLKQSYALHKEWSLVMQGQASHALVPDFFRKYTVAPILVNHRKGISDAVSHVFSRLIKEGDTRDSRNDDFLMQPTNNWGSLKMFDFKELLESDARIDEFILYLKDNSNT